MSCAFHPSALGMGPADDYDELLGWAQRVAALNSNNVLPASWRPMMSTATSLTTIRTEYINAAGRLQQVAAWELPTAIAGTGSLTKPPQVALCLSLRTGRPGRSYRGRMYLPALATPLGSDARVANATCQTIANETAAFLKQLGEAIAAGSAPGGAALGVPQVASAAAGVLTPVTQVQVGDVLDTQRRRRDSLAEQVSIAVL